MAQDKIVVIFFNKGDYHFEHYDSPKEAKDAVRAKYAQGGLTSAMGVKGELLWHARREDSLVFDKEH